MCICQPPIPGLTFTKACDVMTCCAKMYFYGAVSNAGISSTVMTRTIVGKSCYLHVTTMQGTTLDNSTKSQGTVSD